jgi:hypothetical protein
MDPDSDPDPTPATDPDIFDSDLQDDNKKKISEVFLLITVAYFLNQHLHHFSKIKSHKEVTKQ